MEQSQDTIQPPHLSLINQLFSETGIPLVGIPFDI